ncbi:MAG TPA: DUF1957 domain-containing protein, partial [Candidatus Nanopelagicales bacterium]|nr:DUF1957 domain-containing protein [Candidatus Nanopelagicales bacterium]
RLWRHVHHAEGPVRGAIRRARGEGSGEGSGERGGGEGRAGGEAGRALDQAVRELLLLQASDWAFMIDRGEMRGYAEARVRAHAGRARRLAEMASGEAALDPGWLGAVEQASPFLAELAGPQLQDAFDGPG